jgi:hypothetical protein
MLCGLIALYISCSGQVILRRLARLLNINSISGNNCFISFIIIFAFASSLCFKALNLLSLKIKVLSVYIPTNPNAYAIITKKQGLYNKVIIYSLSW